MTPSIVIANSMEDDDDSFTKPLGRRSVIYYGTGHMLNDITAACWFTYLLLFLTDIGLSPSSVAWLVELCKSFPLRGAASVMLSGQIADAFATIFTGELIDRFGHFKIWHGAGSVLVAVSFSSVFGGCMPCSILATSSVTVETISYCVFAAIFNVGWAATQVSHICTSMIGLIKAPSFGPLGVNGELHHTEFNKQGSADELPQCFYNGFLLHTSFDVANLGLYAIALIVFGATKANTHADLENQVYLFNVILAVNSFSLEWLLNYSGTSSTDGLHTHQFLLDAALWEYFISEPKNQGLLALLKLLFTTQGCSDDFLTELELELLKIGLQGNSYARISWTYWFKKVLYYQVALVYMFTRLVLNVSQLAVVTQAYLAFYVINDLRMADSAKALVPAIIYICSFIVSIILQEMVWTGHRLKAYYSVGGILWIFCGAAILILPRSMSAFMYLISIFIGIANALMMVTGISMQNVLIGEDLNGCAFVCGSLSFLDKMSCGIALYILQSYQSTSPKLLDNYTGNAYISVTRYGLGLVPAFCSLLGVAITYTMKLHTPYSKSLREPLLE
ncbi:hypothetical protein JRO89_XS05G0166800 [Xanthoceras sorbifolium]|uniref:Major facilitator superfamily protein n=1 Tax=Xanthoceras sorbifolium TaxID=99658 RepID=A0ABQ8I265_9ROSI|nr:hypothetical protein JRO89_XS05G0166800 [Xanthoceras sorbifolium]